MLDYVCQVRHSFSALVYRCLEARFSVIHVVYSSLPAAPSLVRRNPIDVQTYPGRFSGTKSVSSPFDFTVTMILSSLVGHVEVLDSTSVFDKEYGGPMLPDIR